MTSQVRPTGHNVLVMTNLVYAVYFAILGFGNLKVVASDFSFTVVDADSRQPIAARIYVHSVITDTYHFVRSLSAVAAVPYQKQSKANSRSVEIHTSVPAGAFVAENLPAASYTVTVEKGKEYFPFSISFDLKENQSRPHETLELKRWINMEERGWYSGETHLHRPWDQLPVILLAEDLNVAMPITYWVIDAYDAPRPWDKNPPGTLPDRLIEVDRTHVVWPRNTEYEISKVFGKPHILGALFVLNHTDPIPLGAPNWRPVAEHARSVGALMDLDKLDWPFAMTLPHSTGATLYELANNHMWRTEFGLTKWISEAPAFLQPPKGGSGGDERDWLAYTLGQFYTLLDAGFRLVPTAGTASGVHPVPPGFGRVYVHLEGEFSYDKWIEGLSRGRSFVTTGPMILAQFNRQPPGSTLTQGAGVLTGEVLSEYQLESLEVIRDGIVVSRLVRANVRTESGGYRNTLHYDFDVESSGWLCVRCTEDRPDRRVRFAHTAPWWLEVAAKPLLLMQHEKDYLVKRVSDEITRSKNVLPASALAEYIAALENLEAMKTRMPFSAANDDLKKD